MNTCNMVTSAQRYLHYEYYACFNIKSYIPRTLRWVQHDTVYTCNSMKILHHGVPHTTSTMNTSIPHSLYYGRWEHSSNVGSSIQLNTMKTSRWDFLHFGPCEYSNILFYTLRTQWILQDQILYTTTTTNTSILDFLYYDHCKYFHVRFSVLRPLQLLLNGMFFTADTTITQHEQYISSMKTDTKTFHIRLSILRTLSIVQYNIFYHTNTGSTSLWYFLYCRINRYVQYVQYKNIQRHIRKLRLLTQLPNRGGDITLLSSGSRNSNSSNSNCSNSSTFVTGRPPFSSCGSEALAVTVMALAVVTAMAPAVVTVMALL